MGPLRARTFDLLAIGLGSDRDLRLLHYFPREVLRGGKGQPGIGAPRPGAPGAQHDLGRNHRHAVLGVLGSYAGGELIGGFADIAITHLGLPTIPTAAALAFFAGVSEYIIVVKSHRRGELGIALSNVFGGMTQVMFLLLPFVFHVIGVLGMSAAQAPTRCRLISRRRCSRSCCFRCSTPAPVCGAEQVA